MRKQRAPFSQYSIQPIREWADYVLLCHTQGLLPIFKDEVIAAVLIIIGVIKTKGEAEEKRGRLLRGDEIEYE